MLPQTAVFCRRDLRVSTGSREWNLACTHPQSDVPFTAQEALAYSCNRYFAALADRMTPAQVSATLEHYGLGHIQTPQTREQKELLVLGFAGIAVSPTQIASAYRKLALELDDPRAPTVLDPVREGLRDSVRYGMAHNAAIPGMDVAGKTGTSNEGGWFAGVGSFAQEQMVLVIYLPRGNGADAARLAQRFFLSPSTLESARSLTIELWAANISEGANGDAAQQGNANKGGMVTGWAPNLARKHDKKNSPERSFSHASRRSRRTLWPQAAGPSPGSPTACVCC